jgi:hypothetical protein
MYAAQSKIIKFKSSQEMLTNLLSFIVSWIKHKLMKVRKRNSMIIIIKLLTNYMYVEARVKHCIELLSLFNILIRIKIVLHQTKQDTMKVCNFRNVRILILACHCHLSKKVNIVWFGQTKPPARHNLSNSFEWHWNLSRNWLDLLYNS